MHQKFKWVKGMGLGDILSYILASFYPHFIRVPANLVQNTKSNISIACIEKKEIDKEMESLDAEIKAMELKVAERNEEIAKCDSAIKVL